LKAADAIRNQQRAWARRRGIVCDSRGYVASLEQNLYSFPMDPETRLAFESARNRELRTSAGQGRMRALDSSSALLVNFFEYWLRRGVGSIAGTCGATQPMTLMRFLPTFASPLGDTRRTHIDLEFTGVGTPLLVQSTFAESYHRFKNRRLGTSHLKDAALWRQLPRAEDLARRIEERAEVRAHYLYLDAPRLLKHIAGLTSRCGVKGFQLLYLWYDLPSAESDKHKEEIKEFTDCVREEVLLSQMSYQQLFQAVRQLPGVEASYLSYLRERYFADVGHEESNGRGEPRASQRRLESSAQSLQ
jgi:hypothetical protein